MKRKILIVEDNRGIQMSLKDEFEAEGYETLVAGNGEEGLRLALEEKPDLVLIDDLKARKFAKIYTIFFESATDH